MTVAMLDGVCKSYGGAQALVDATVSIDDGDTVALLGPNGAGKSTLVSLLLGLRRPDTGTVVLAGRDPRDHRARATVGAALQDVLFPPTLRVAEIAAFVAAHRPGGTGAADAVGRFGLERLARRQAGGLSGGERRRLALALAFLGSPRVVVLDEPTASLDEDGREAVWKSIGEARGAGTAVLVATHDLAEAEAVASRVVALDRGRVVVTGSVAEVTARAGLTRLAYAGAPPPAALGFARADGRWTADVDDAAAIVERLVREGIRLDRLEVRPLTLAESLARLRRETP